MASAFAPPVYSDISMGCGRARGPWQGRVRELRGPLLERLRSIFMSLRVELVSTSACTGSCERWEGGGRLNSARTGSVCDVTSVSDWGCRAPYSVPDGVYRVGSLQTGDAVAVGGPTSYSGDGRPSWGVGVWSR